MFINTRTKYAPKTIADFIYPSKEVELMVKSYIGGKNQTPLLLYGPSGTGKSLLARLIPNAIEKQKADIYKVCAFEINNIDGLNELKKNKSLANLTNDVMKYYVIEEYEMKLTTIASLKMLLDNDRYNDLTIFTSNHYNKVDNAIKSKCKTIIIPPAKPKEFLPLAMKILKGEQVKLTQGTVLELLEEVYSKYADNRKYYEALDELIFEVNEAKAQTAKAA